MKDRYAGDPLCVQRGCGARPRLWPPGPGGVVIFRCPERRPIFASAPSALSDPEITPLRSKGLSADRWRTVVSAADDHRPDTAATVRTKPLKSNAGTVADDADTKGARRSGAAELSLSERRCRPSRGASEFSCTHSAVGHGGGVGRQGSMKPDGGVPRQDGEASRSSDRPRPHLAKAVHRTAAGSLFPDNGFLAGQALGARHI
jgi:hypothetical protein